jgi:hypothetical protein
MAHSPKEYMRGYMRRYRLKVEIQESTRELGETPNISLKQSIENAYHAEVAYINSMINLIRVLAEEQYENRKQEISVFIDKTVNDLVPISTYLDRLPILLERQNELANELLANPRVQSIPDLLEHLNRKKEAIPEKLALVDEMKKVLEKNEAKEA